MEKHLIASCIGDLHLSTKPPIFRSVEENWVKTQEGYLTQVADFVRANSIPLFLAGDIFDKPDVAPEIITVAIRSFVGLNLFACAGNHDLHFHRLDQLHRSAYGTLVEAGILRNLEPYMPGEILHPKGHMRIWGFACDVEIKPVFSKSEDYFDIALIHDMIWEGNKGYTGAPDSKHVKSHLKNLQNYSLAIFSDNHIPFEYYPEDPELPIIFNCGCFSIRKSSERNYKPSIGLIYSDGSVGRHYLNISQDKYLEVEEIENLIESIGANSFTEALLELGDCALDFAAYIKHLLNKEKVDTRVKELILTSLQKYGQKSGG